MDNQSHSDFDSRLQACLYRLTSGVHKGELDVIVNESKAAEELIANDVKRLELALNSNEQGIVDDDIRDLLESSSTPLDGFWTAGALLGRLRGDLAIPRNASTMTDSAATESHSTNPALKINGDIVHDESSSPLSLEEFPEYTEIHDNPIHLLGLHKKLQSHKSSIVFKKPVKEEDAPGYTTRILFPVDLSLVRKQIVARQIVSLQNLHQRLGMISFNCCKYNGRESDYGEVAREFEQTCDDLIRQSVLEKHNRSKTLSSTDLSIPTRETEKLVSETHSSSKSPNNTATTTSATIGDVSLPTITTTVLTNAKSKSSTVTSSYNSSDKNIEIHTAVAENLNAIVGGCL